MKETSTYKELLKKNKKQLEGLYDLNQKGGIVIPNVTVYESRALKDENFISTFWPKKSPVVFVDKPQANEEK